MSDSRDTHQDLSQLSAEEKRSVLAELLQNRKTAARTYPLSFAQERLWFLHQLRPQSTAYNLASGLRLTGTVEVEALHKGLRRVTSRHEVLRTCFESREDGPVQRVDPHIEPSLRVIDFSSLPRDEREPQAAEWARTNARTPFDLQKGPLVRLSLLRIAPDEAMLVFAMHHIIGDRTSIEILIREISAAYQEEVAPSAASASHSERVMPDLPVQYGDFATWQRETLQGTALDAKVKHWVDALEDLPPSLSLPTDYPRPVVQSDNGAICRFDIPDDLVLAAETLVTEERATLFMTLLSAFYVLLYRYTGQNDIAVGTPVDNRGRSDIESLIGFFVNTLVLRGRLSGKMTFRELLRQVRTQTLEAYDHRDVPFAAIVDGVAEERSLNRQSLFQVMFSVQHGERSRLQLPGVQVDPLELDSGTEQFDLNLRLSRTESGIDGLLSYNTDLFSAETAARLTRHYIHLLRSITEAPNAPVSSLTILSRKEKSKILGTWNDTETRLPEACLVHQEVESRAQSHPDAVALIRETGGKPRQCTHEALQDRVECIARALMQVGVRPGDVVGLYLRRSMDVPAAILGVLKAGAAYVPLDPSFPEKRLQYIIEDAAPTVVLTDPGASIPHQETVQVHTISSLLDEAVSPEMSKASGRPFPYVGHESLAYVTYTSGSTGEPKGVEIPHRAVVNFMRGMDERIGGEEGCWLAVTTISFDISVLELVWTLTRGYRVVLSEPLRAPSADALPTGEPAGDGGLDQPTSSRKTAARSHVSDMEFGLFYFANDAETVGQNPDRPYRLLLEGADFADRNGFSAVWTPERHFDRFGGLYPNPAVTGAAVASRTQHIDVRAGSVVMPLHHPVRVAESFSVIDNLAGGAAGISFASGWHRNDFVFAPDTYETRKKATFDGLDTVRRLWRGERLVFPGVDGDDVAVQLHPKPTSSHLNAWITSGGNPETFRMAGEHGAYLLTHLLGQSLEDLRDKIQLYRDAWNGAGHPPGESHVSLMLHTFVGTDDSAVREIVREPFKDYMKRSIGLLEQLASAIGKQPDEGLSEDEIDAVADVAFRRYYDGSGLLGTVEACVEQARRINAAGVDEIAALIDFGIEADQVMDHLPNLARVQEACREASRGSSMSNKGSTASQSDRGPQRPIHEQMRRYRVTHLQCTPSMAQQMLDSKSLKAIRDLQVLLLGGEVYPKDLADTLQEAAPRTQLLNMYGPTETTVWSSTHELNGVPRSVPIGRPIANTQVYVVDKHLKCVPIGVPGDLLIGGAGLAQGYRNLPAQTAESFIPNPFQSAQSSGKASTRLYRTGDVVAWRPDGTLVFHGREDHQVKIRGHRIELGDVSAAFESHDRVQRAITCMDGDGPNARLVTYVKASTRSATNSVAQQLREASVTTPWTHPDGNRLLDGHDRYTLPDGRVIAHQQAHVTSGLYQEIFKTNSYLRHGLRIEPGDCIFDVGANIGIFSLFAHTLAPGVTVHAFEPIPETSAVLRANLDLHGVNSHVHPVGLAEEEGEATFTYYPHTSGLSSRYGDVDRDREVARNVIREGWRVQVDPENKTTLPEDQIEHMLDSRFTHRVVNCPLRTLSGVLEASDVASIDLLKIDVERAEADVLRGLEDEDWARIRQVVLEADTEALLAECQAMLEANGFATHAEPLAITGHGEDGSAQYVYLLYATTDPAGLVIESNGETPIAWASTENPTSDSLDPESLRPHVRRRLPRHMVPHTILRVDSFPLTPNGKVDRDRLSSLEATAESSRTGAAPKTHVQTEGTVEKTIEDAWKAVLELDKVGAHSNFFELGGTSLQMALVHRRLTESVDASLTLLDLFQYPTVRALAEHLASDPEVTTDSQADAVRRRAEKRRQARRR